MEETGQLSSHPGGSWFSLVPCLLSCMQGDQTKGWMLQDVGTACTTFPKTARAAMVGDQTQGSGLRTQLS